MARRPDYSFGETKFKKYKFDGGSTTRTSTTLDRWKWNARNKVVRKGGSGRRAKGKPILYFDANRYITDLRKEMKVAAGEIGELLVAEIINNISALPLKTNAVRLAGGYETSDEQRRQALVDSIMMRARNLSKDVTTVTVSAMANNFKESHIGVYYEYGTGDMAEPDPRSLKYAGLGDTNIYRMGRSIVSRSLAHNQGYWRDMGGNVRETDSFRGGQRDEGFIRYVGDDVMAHHWYERAVDAVRSQVKSILLRHLRKLNLLVYLRHMNTFILGVD